MMVTNHCIYDGTGSLMTGDCDGATGENYDGSKAYKRSNTLDDGYNGSSSRLDDGYNGSNPMATMTNSNNRLNPLATMTSYNGSNPMLATMTNSNSTQLQLRKRSVSNYKIFGFQFSAYVYVHMWFRNDRLV